VENGEHLTRLGVVLHAMGRQRSGIRAERKCCHGSLPAAIRGIPEEFCSPPILFAVIHFGRCIVTLLAESKMKLAWSWIALAVILVPCFSGQVTSAPEQSEIDSANRLFEAGKFVEAGKLYARIAAQKPKDYSATLQLGRIALLSNRLDDAQRWLEEAIALRPGDTDAKVMLPRRIIAATTFNGRRLR
jgi:tetratricopeptide (TPR) repeat protein